MLGNYKPITGGVNKKLFVREKALGQVSRNLNQEFICLGSYYFDQNIPIDAAIYSPLQDSLLQVIITVSISSSIVQLGKIGEKPKRDWSLDIYIKPQVHHKNSLWS